ncbi:MAG: PAS domain S-box protein [Vicinamibacterales bacterium]
MLASPPEAGVSTRLRLDAAGRIASWTAAATSLFGLSESSALGQPVSALLAPAAQAIIATQLSALASSPADDVRTLQTTIARADASRVCVDCALWRTESGFDLFVHDITARVEAHEVMRREREAFRGQSEEQACELTGTRARFTGLTETLDDVVDADGTVSRDIGIVEDVAGRKAAEAAVRRQDTLDAIGQMAGGLAHDFNNILSVVVGHLDLISLAIPGDAPERESLDRATDAALRGERLARRLLALARQEPAERRAICLAAAIEGLAPLLQYVVGTTSEVMTAAATRPAVSLDPGELDAALITLP